MAFKTDIFSVGCVAVGNLSSGCVVNVLPYYVFGVPDISAF